MKLLEIGCLALALACQPGHAAESAPETQGNVHGFASLGYIDTKGNNFYGDTRDGGAVDYYEAGLNGFLQLHPLVSVSGQALVRKAGETDDGRLRLDYGFVDVQAPGTQSARFGLRLGRVRNPLGFYNETRDVIFTRPSILLPQSTYQEGNGIRTLLFSSDGGQFYADWDHGNSHTAASLTLAMDRHVSDETKRNATEVTPPFRLEDLKMRKPVFAQILHELDGGRLRLALSYVDFQVTSDLVDGNTLLTYPLTAREKTYILSAQYNAETWTLTSEYEREDATTEVPSLGLSGTSHGDGIYLQWQYRFTPRWIGLLRGDLLYPDRSNREDGVSRDSTIGLRWLPRPDWLLSGEFHRIRGTVGIPRADNLGMTLSPNTSLFALMLGYRF